MRPAIFFELGISPIWPRSLAGQGPVENLGRLARIEIHPLGSRHENAKEKPPGRLPRPGGRTEGKCLC